MPVTGFPGADQLAPATLSKGEQAVDCLSRLVRVEGGALQFSLFFEQLLHSDLSCLQAVATIADQAHSVLKVLQRCLQRLLSAFHSLNNRFQFFEGFFELPDPGTGFFGHEIVSVVGAVSHPGWGSTRCSGILSQRRNNQQSCPLNISVEIGLGAVEKGAGFADRAFYQELVTVA